MKKRTGILAISMILLLTSLSVSPVFAQQTSHPLATLVSDRLSLTNKDINALDTFYASLLGDLAGVKDLAGFNKLIDRYILRYGDHPLFRFLHRLAIYATLERHLICFSTLRTSAWVLSIGSVNRFFCRQPFHFNFYRPYTFWFYGNVADAAIKSRTLVIDFHPFSIRNVDGRQLGFMTNFYGVYLQRDRSLLGGEHTFIFGHAQRVRVLDLSPFN